VRHRYDCHVRFSDVDVYGHVNNVKYFEYYQEARLAFLGSLDRAPDQPPSGLVVARIDVDYRRPILFRPEPYLVETWVTRVGNSSFGLSSEIREGDDVYSRAQATMVSFDLRAQQSCPISEEQRARLDTAMEEP
jgi:acyl-CoA thioester hydrolase